MQKRPHTEGEQSIMNISRQHIQLSAKTLMLWLLCLLTAVPSIHAQQPGGELENIMKRLSTEKNDSIRAYLSMQVANRLEAKDSIKVMQYFQQAQQLSRKYNPRLSGRIYLSMSGWYMERDEHDQSDSVNRLAMTLLNKDTSREGKRIYYRAAANLAYRKLLNGDNRGWTHEYLELIPKVESVRDTSHLIHLYNDLASNYTSLLEFRQSIPYFLRSISYMKAADASPHSLAKAEIGLATAMAEMDSVNGLDTRLQQARQHLDQIKDTLPIWSAYYYALGKYKYRLGENTAATTAFRQGLALAQRMDLSWDVLNNMLGLATTWQKTNQHQDALTLMNEAYPLSRQIKEGPFILDVLRLRAASENKLGLYAKAAGDLQDYITLSDSIQRAATARMVLDLDAKYQSDRKERQIQQLQHDNERTSLILDKHRLFVWLLTMIAIALLLIVIFIFLFYRNSRKLLFHQQRLHQLELDRVKQEHRISLLSAMLDGQEQERTRLARDLHDGLGGLLSAVKLQLADMSRVLTQPGEQSLLQKIARHMDNAIDELRRVARNMMPEILLRYGLGEAVQEYCRALKAPGTAITCQVFNYKDNDNRSTQTVVYRIMQELVNNAVKYASASQILVQLQQTDNRLFLTVEDNGVGFDVKAASSNIGSTGLNNIYARTAFLNGKINIDSQPGNGTAVFMECEFA
ncbi:sensor histidine kinase [Chitinophaga pendula]|uniref:ATP-binding protein n=1 Tax=Chitinophaga TaxID=79328 RepID=UPI000BB05C3C|nr:MULTISPECIES: sensor histidine kinase [Chitinophaga]ASZ13830.1 hypothetical protein CK934_24180 [Chitinophaga sp. MD30]UCJ08547.1 sensor histidine kinase [Chitinophaga pendula]